MDTENNYQLSVQENHLVPGSSIESDTDLAFIQKEILEPLKPIKTIVSTLFHSIHFFNFLVKVFDFYNSENHSEMMISEKEMFIVFATLKPECTNILISKLDCPLYTKNDLMELIQKKDYEGFNKLVRSRNCDFTRLERLCNVLFHCITFHNYCKELISDTIDKLEKGVNNDDDDELTILLKKFMAKWRDTLIAISNNRDESYQIALILETRILELDKEDTTYEGEEKDKMMPNPIAESFFSEVAPYLYAIVCKYLNLLEREKIESSLKILIPSITFVAMDDNTINTGLMELSYKYPDIFAKMFSMKTFEEGIIQGILLVAREEDELNISFEEPLSIENNQTDMFAEQSNNSNGIETNEGELEDCDTDSKKECLTTTQRTKKIKYKVDGLANRGSAAKGENFQWSDDLKKWYEKHQKEFEEFVKYVAAEKGYIPNEQGQVNAFIRTITGRDVPRCDEKVKLNNNTRNDATRAMMYLIKKKIIIGNLSDVFTNFDVERPQRYKDDKKNNSWMGGYARDANEDFKKKVEEIFADFLEPQPRES